MSKCTPSSRSIAASCCSCSQTWYASAPSTASVSSSSAAASAGEAPGRTRSASAASSSSMRCSSAQAHSYDSTGSRSAPRTSRRAIACRSDPTASPSAARGAYSSRSQRAVSAYAACAAAAAAASSPAGGPSPYPRTSSPWVALVAYRSAWSADSTACRRAAGRPRSSPSRRLRRQLASMAGTAASRARTGAASPLPRLSSSTLSRTPATRPKGACRSRSGSPASCQSSSARSRPARNVAAASSAADSGGNGASLDSSVRVLRMRSARAAYPSGPKSVPPPAGPVTPRMVAHTGSRAASWVTYRSHRSKTGLVTTPTLVRRSPDHYRGGDRGAEAAEHLVAERVGVRGVQLGAVPDEGGPLAGLPADGEQRAEPGDQQAERPPRPDAAAGQQQPGAQRQEEPVDQVVGVVPPAHRVVEVQGVAGDVDEEGQHQQREGAPGQRAGAAAAAAGQRPQRRHQQHEHRVGQEPAGERLALELRQSRHQSGDQQLPDRADQQRDRRRPAADLGHVEVTGWRTTSSQPRSAR